MATSRIKMGVPVDHLDWRVIQFVNLFGAAVDLYVVFELSHLGRAGGKNQILISDCVRYIGRRKSLRL